MTELPANPATKDLITGDEIISDSYKLIDIDDVVYEIDCKKVVKKGVDVDIGANPSAEGDDAEALEEGAETVIDVVDSFRLVNMPFGNKKSFLGQFKGMAANQQDALNCSPYTRLPQKGR